MSDTDKDKDFAPINVEINDRIPMSSQRQSNAKSTNGETTSNNKFTSFVLVVAVIACAASGYLYATLQDSKKVITANEARLKTLENKLSATGEEMGNSTVALQVKFTELAARTDDLWEQMDKLWASAWRRNQQDIKTVVASVEKIQSETSKLAKTLDSKVAENKTSIGSMQSRVDGINTKLNNQANDVLAVNVKQDEYLQGVSGQKDKLREMTEKLILIEKRNTTLLQQLQQLEKKLDELANKSV